MKLPRDLGGSRLADHLIRHWGYVKVNQVGSHIILQTSAPARNPRPRRTPDWNAE